MAWKARLADEINYAGGKIAAHIEYYDDATPSLVLHAENFTFEPALTNGAMNTMIQSRGQEVRAAKNRADALAVAFPQATTVINIP